jgi:hypothetical protein
VPLHIAPRRYLGTHVSDVASQIYRGPYCGLDICSQGMVVLVVVDPVS